MVAAAIDKTRRRARAALESTYEGICDIIEYGAKKDPVTKLTAMGELTVLEGQPCRLSFSSSPATRQTDLTANVVQSIKLFLAPEPMVKAGSKIVVTQYGRTTAYQCSGKPALYATHQEISLELYRERA